MLSGVSRLLPCKSGCCGTRPYKDERRTFCPPYRHTRTVPDGRGAGLLLRLPMAWKFFLSFEMPAAPGVLPIQLEARVSEYLSLSMTIIFAFGLAFQLPVVLVLLTRIGLLSAAKLSQFRRYAIVLIFVSAVFSPPGCHQPDQPRRAAIILYEASIWAARWVEKGRPESSASSGPQDEASI